MPVADFSLAGKVAIVTGGSRGIGRQIALGLAEHGADVALAARKPDALAAAVSATGRRAISVSSIGGFLASDVIGGYSVSKAALNMLAQVQAKTWGRDGIRVNCIAPGLIQTEFSRALWENPKFLEPTLRDTALRRIATPDEMAGAAVFLASRASSFVTGQTLILDGGRRL